MGGPLRTDRIWFWTGASRNDARQLSINGMPDDGAVNIASARGDAQAGTATRFSFLYHYSEKLRTGRFAGRDRAPEATLNQDGATQIAKAEVSQVFGQALFLSGKFAYIDAEFGLTPQGGMNAQVYRDFAAQVWHGSFEGSRQNRAQYQTQIDGNWQGGAHDVKFGFQHRRTFSDNQSALPGDGTYTVVNAEGLGLPPGVGFANLTRRSAVLTETAALSGYVGDVLAIDRWTFDLGMRFDWQRTRNRPSHAPANGLAPSISAGARLPGWPVSRLDRFVAAPRHHAAGDEPDAGARQLCPISKPAGVERRDVRECRVDGHDSVSPCRHERRSPRASRGAARPDRQCVGREPGESSGAVRAKPRGSRHHFAHAACALPAALSRRSLPVSRWR